MLKTLLLKETKPKKVDANEIIMITSGDLREAANTTCWPTQLKFEKKLQQCLLQRGYKLTRAFPINSEVGHGFLRTQREGCDSFANIDPDAPLIVLLTAWQYSHYVAPCLVHHRGPILLLANFEGTWPGLVGMLCLAGTLTSLGKNYSRLWSENFDDEFFNDSLDIWLKHGSVQHNTQYLHDILPVHPFMSTSSADIGRKVGNYILRNKAIMGLFDTFCMGMINGVFPQQSLINIGMPLESLSQSALLVEMTKVPKSLRKSCLEWYEKKGMNFKFGTNSETELTREQVEEQCAMMIAMARFYKRFGLSSVGVQYQQGLKESCAASDFAEGAIGSTDRFPIPDEQGNIIEPNKPIACINEVDMGTAIPQTMLWHLLTSLNLPAETTLHDVRWGSEYEGVFYWDFEISGAVPFEHLKGGISGATGYRQPAMFFPYGGSTIAGQGKAGRFIWSRAHYEGLDVIIHIGTGHAVELPEKEFERRRKATNYEWPLMNAVLDGLTRNDFMAGHQSNHITIAYVDENELENVLKAFVSQALTQNIKVKVAGDAFNFFNIE